MNSSVRSVIGSPMNICIQLDVTLAVWQGVKTLPIYIQNSSRDVFRISTPHDKINFAANRHLQMNLLSSRRRHGHRWKQAALTVWTLDTARCTETTRRQRLQRAGPCTTPASPRGRCRVWTTSRPRRRTPVCPTPHVCREAFEREPEDAHVRVPCG